MFWRSPLRNCRKYCKSNQKYTIAFGGQRVYDNDNERDRPSAESLPASNDFFLGGEISMRKMQRFAALGLAGTMALSLAACGGSSASTTDSTPASTASSTEATAESTASGDSVTLNWALWDKDSTAYWAALADGYMASHPGVTIEMTDLGSTDYMTQLATQLARRQRRAGCPLHQGHPRLLQPDQPRYAGAAERQADHR